MIDFIVQSIGEIISFILGAVVMLIMGISSLYNKKKKWDEI